MRRPERRVSSRFFFFFNDTATTEIYTLSLHDALPIYVRNFSELPGARATLVSDLDERRLAAIQSQHPGGAGDRKSTRLNSSHLVISYAVFCLKKKNSDLVPEQRAHRELSALAHGQLCS